MRHSDNDYDLGSIYTVNWWKIMIIYVYKWHVGTGVQALVNGQASLHPGKDTMDELADKDKFFHVTYKFFLFVL